jgi:hypothetical protein
MKVFDPYSFAPDKAWKASIKSLHVFDDKAKPFLLSLHNAKARQPQNRFPGPAVKEYISSALAAEPTKEAYIPSLRAAKNTIELREGVLCSKDSAKPILFMSGYKEVTSNMVKQASDEGILLSSTEKVAAYVAQHSGYCLHKGAIELLYNANNASEHSASERGSAASAKPTSRFNPIAFVTDDEWSGLVKGHKVMDDNASSLIKEYFESKGSGAFTDEQLMRYSNGAHELRRNAESAWVPTFVDVRKKMMLQNGIVFHAKSNKPYLLKSQYKITVSVLMNKAAADDIAFNDADEAARYVAQHCGSYVCKDAIAKLFLHNGKSSSSETLERDNDTTEKVAATGRVEVETVEEEEDEFEDAQEGIDEMNGAVGGGGTEDALVIQPTGENNFQITNRSGATAAAAIIGLLKNGGNNIQVNLGPSYHGNGNTFHQHNGADNEEVAALRKQVNEHATALEGHESALEEHGIRHEEHDMRDEEQESKNRKLANQVHTLSQKKGPRRDSFSNKENEDEDDLATRLNMDAAVETPMAKAKGRSPGIFNRFFGRKPVAAEESDSEGESDIEEVHPWFGFIPRTVGGAGKECSKCDYTKNYICCPSHRRQVEDFLAQRANAAGGGSASGGAVNGSG